MEMGPFLAVSSTSLHTPMKDSHSCLKTLLTLSSGSHHTIYPSQWWSLLNYMAGPGDTTACQQWNFSTKFRLNPVHIDSKVNCTEWNMHIFTKAISFWMNEGKQHPLQPAVIGGSFQISCCPVLLYFRYVGMANVLCRTLSNGGGGNCWACKGEENEGFCF